jgi:sterol desaturase/sphingolipid hydroxylase (fatty acid hydroxylase superfamily)
MVLEMMLIRALLVRGRYAWRDTCASLSMRVGNYVSNVLLAGVTVAVFAAFYQHRWLDLSSRSPLAWAALVILDDFAYYWFHRISHECRLWWAAHVNHHSSREYNLSTAARQSWTGIVVGTWTPWIPLAFLGFTPTAILLMQSINLFYQFWLHTEAVDRLPKWFEAIFNTPSHHRVHHASNPRYLDRNYAGVLMIWDRWFGTFEAETPLDATNYGILHNIESYNPIIIAFHEWRAMAGDLIKAKSLRARIGHIFGVPGWQPDGGGETSESARNQWRQSVTTASSV